MATRNEDPLPNQIPWRQANQHHNVPTTTQEAAMVVQWWSGQLIRMMNGHRDELRYLHQQGQISLQVYNQLFASTSTLWQALWDFDVECEHHEFVNQLEDGDLVTAASASSS